MARATKAARDEVDEQVPTDEATEAQDPGGDGKPSTFAEEMRSTIREAAVEVLKPVARKATTSAAKYAVTRGPDMVKDKVGDIGGAAGLKDTLGKGGDLVSGLTDKIAKKGGGKADGTGRGRRLPVQEFVDVAVPIDVAYDQFTQFEDFPQFMHRVEKVEQRDDTTLVWHENIWGIRRQWEAEITEQEPCERIAWRSTGGTQNAGVVTFHELSDRLTRVYVNLDFQPKGILEKSASGMRHSRRALRSDLMRFKAFLEMRDEATGEWRGRIEEGEVVDEPEAREDEGIEEEEEEREERPRRRGKGRFARDEEPEAEEDEDFEEEEDEEEEEPAPERKPARRRTATKAKPAKAKARR
jgi:uncharacterized membrane protein